MFLTVTTVQAQITIGGNVFGGARQAFVRGDAAVTIHGGTASSDMITITGVYGGNDIAGTVNGGSTVTTDGGGQLFVGQLFGGGNGDYDYTEVLEGDDDAEGHVGKYRVTHLVWDEDNNVWKTELLGYVDEVPESPEITNAAINLTAGTFGYVYGGGNAATVTNSSNITIDIPEAKNPLDINGADETTNTNLNDDLISDANLQAMGINTEFFNQNGKFHISRLFGGNNKATMAIQPSWHLNRGRIENLYSGGNEGSMTSETGLLLDINPYPEPTGISAAEADALRKQLVIENVFGGCRKANVEPRFQSGEQKGEIVDHVEPPTGYAFPRDFAARVLVYGGDINNVYGGNDVSGHVYFGNAVGVYTSIRGNIYGGGNGSYAYTDNVNIKEKFPLRYGDFYYNPDEVLEKAEVTLPSGTSDGMKSAKALNLFRPDAEQVSIRVLGTEEKKTIIGGSIYCGGNSATLKFDNDKAINQDDYPNYPIVELKIGNDVVANEVFLGNNGANMVKKENEDIEYCVLYKYKWGVDPTLGDISETTSTDGWLDYSKMDFTDTTIDSDTKRTQFEEYMEGCAMGIVPRVVFDTDYKEYRSYIGSLYCGGNVGSMTVDGLISIPFNDKVVIFEKVVGGCNNANVDAVKDENNVYYNTAYNGGLLNSADATTGNKLELTFNGLKIQPKRWNKDGSGNYIMDSNGYPLQWNTVKFDVEQNKYVQVNPITSGTYSSGQDADDDDLARRLSGGNIYGGCYSSGHVNGNVVINLDASIVDRDRLFDEVKKDALGEEESLYGSDLLTPVPYKILQRHTGVILGQQGMDVLGKSLNVFGGGYGSDSEIWGSTTINLNKGYAFQIFGGGESGAIGRKNGTSYSYDPKYSCFINLRGTKDGKTKKDDSSEDMAECEFIYGGGFFGTIAGNTVVNLGKGRVFNTFGGSCNADILGHTETYVGRQVKGEYTKEGNTGNYSKEMLKHYLDHYLEADYSGPVKFQAHEDFYEDGFPYVRDIVYGGNDLGGKILGESNESGGANGADCDFSYRVNTSVRGMVHNPSNSAHPDVLKASAYVEYTQGRADAIFGGCFGTYDYKDPHYGEYFYATGASDLGENIPGSARSDYSRPRMNNAFVNFRPISGVTSQYNTVGTVYGAGQGYPDMLERDELQNRSYVLINIPQGIDNYQDMKVFGAGAWAGVGMRTPVALDASVSVRDAASAIIDLMSGKVGAAYGASYKEGFTRRTVVNVPGGISSGSSTTTLNSTIDIQKIFGGGEGVADADGGYENAKPCDAYEANVNYSSPAAIVRGAIYGGNNAYRRTVYSKVNINAPVYNGESDYNGKPMTTRVFGAGFGENTWSQYTEVNLNEGAEVFEVYGGGEKGRVLNEVSLAAWNADPDDSTTPMDLSMGYLDSSGYDLKTLVTANADGSRHNTNVHIKENAIVDWYYVTKTNDKNHQTYQTYDGGYAYGGGLGASGVAESGDVLGTTYIDLLGGLVRKDIYGAGTQGSVMDKYGVKDDESNDYKFTASSNVFIKGGMARNVYGGGWAGSVGKHAGVPTDQNVTDDEGNIVYEDEEQTIPKKETVMDYLEAPYTDDILGETHVVIGTLDGTSFTNGIPAIERNAYGGGEGGAVWGKTHITLNNGFIGYRHFDSASAVEDNDCEVISLSGAGAYQAKLHDETWYGDQTNRLLESGCLFGGGYIDNSSVDETQVMMYGGTVRNSLFGGGEIAAIGRGKVSGIEKERTLVGIYRAGKTLVGMFDGWVKRNVFGGGRGYNNLGENGKLYSDGYVFGQTEVHIHGGEVGTDEGVARGDGNVFGGGDVGYVYSAYQDASDRLAVGKKAGTRYGTDNNYDGYYYKYEGSSVALDSNGEFQGGGFVGGTPTQLTEDCKVLIEPECKVTKDGFTGYPKGEYVPITVLNTFGKKSGDGADPNWDYFKKDVNDLDQDEGVIIHNAVFAGGNVTSGSDKLYANATTVFGNATASIHDVYNCDLITIGTGHTGGLYGDGNLTFVDGYRGLNITNYGTDYYSIKKEIDEDTYDDLPVREKAYYELRFKYIGATPVRDNAGKEYHCEVVESGVVKTAASVITLDEFLAVFEGEEYDYLKDGDGMPNTTYWERNGVCSRYMGRIMNTIQRADFCGVFGSRMVMQGAEDRVPSTADKKQYTINRVREVSLNKPVGSGSVVEHGNYFGIYNVVNNLGNLTSDVDFHTTVRTTDADTEKKPELAEDGKTFYDWKEYHRTDRTRNNGKSYNEVALASGVYLEIKDMDILEKQPNAASGDEWGYITGVVELDLINVQPGIGGGFVYAKNEHRQLDNYVDNEYATLTALNATAVSRKDYTYKTTSASDDYDDGVKVEFETSGNFVHSTQVIIDDCYPKSKQYLGVDAMAVHYWFIKGEVYVYDQYITAYTGSPNAYNETVDIPLTITAASNGEIKLLNVQPNLYAYYSSYSGDPSNGGSGTKLGPTEELEINNVKYKLNDPISYWDWYMMSKQEQNLFRPETYVTVESCMIGENFYPEGYVMLPGDYETLKSSVNSSLSDGTQYQYIYNSYTSKQTWSENDNNPAQWDPQTGSGEYLGPTGYTWSDDLNSTYDYQYVSVRSSKDGGLTWSKYSTPSLLPVVYKATKVGDADPQVVTDSNGNPVLRNFDYVFRESNNMSHETGYILTYKVDNPLVWDTWYTEYSDGANTSNVAKEKDQDKSTLESETIEVGGKVKELGPNDGPTYRYVGSGSGELLGQRSYSQGNLISNEVYTTYITAKSNHSSAVPGNQADFYPAYIMTAEVDEVYKKIYKDGEYSPTKVNLYEGAAVAEEEYSEADWAKISPYIEAAYISTKTITLSETEFISLNKKMGQTELNSYLNSDKYTAEQKAEIQASVVPAYYCTKDGMYGGDYYAAGTNYRGLAAWSSMSAEDREKFEFNYDAFDLLIDSSYGGTEGRKYQYDGKDENGEDFTTENQAKTNPAGYSIPQSVDYQATYNDGASTIDLEDSKRGFVYYEADYTPSTPAKKHEILVNQELEREAYEALPNEQRYYAPITIVKNEDGSTCYNYYVAREEFFTADSNFPVGSVITADTYAGLLQDQKNKCINLKFSESLPLGTTFYYCRQEYTAGEKGGDYDEEHAKVIVVEPISATSGETGQITQGYTPKTITDGVVPAGLIIDATQYASLPNKQKDFSIHGKSPVETSTLFVSRNSDIFDLSKERIITVVYQYDYDESDVTKTHITPIRERHVVNIHIKFESGIPTIEDISAPKIVIPGTGVTMKEPFVTPGAYEVTGGGWELFETLPDVESHTNGIEYKPGDPLYWYQDGFYLTYYAETYLGKTYSNEVPVSVANYHDLKTVMDAVKHHYYIDKRNVHRDPKIYINDYSGSDENGLDILKNLFDLSVLDDTKVSLSNGLINKTKNAAGEETTTDSPFKGHALLNNQVKAARNLEFFLHTNIEHTGDWTPIGNDNVIDNPETTNQVEGECFQGTLHGDGYYISGLTNSLFAHLCGNVYNLGVTGSFRGAGVAEEGSGFVENCWISTSTTESKTSKPIFNNPTIIDDNRPLRIVNCYYQEEDEGVTYPYTNHTVEDRWGVPVRKNKRAFYSGEVAYDLNGFYLYKRYRDNMSGSSSGTDYWFFNGNTLAAPVSASYGTADGTYSSSGSDRTYEKGYVEDRYADGDFIYASGRIPDGVNERFYVPTSASSSIPSGYYPIWPDDYIFFGQVLSYGHDTDRAHQDVPSNIIKDGDMIRIEDGRDPVDNHLLYGNRVYRAPAYFRDSKMSVAHFNTYAIFAQTKKNDDNTLVFKGMTAIDFTGGNGDVASGYKLGKSQASPYNNVERLPDGAFYPPLLDDDGLTDFQVFDLTKNLLAYTGTIAPAAAATNSVVATRLPDLAYQDNKETKAAYKAAIPWNKYSPLQVIKGHRVELTSGGYIAQNDHFLMDKEDFNAPIEYSFASDGDPETVTEGDKRMWYQREPGEPWDPDKPNNGLNYVGWKNSTTGEFIDSDSGWEGISLPFTADLVTTDVKGEITHFYKDSRSVSTSGSKTGHEYWLREFTGGAMSDKTGEENVLKADMKYPGYGDEDATGEDKEYTNTFLWDYYYSYNNYDDANRDNYQEKEDNATYYYKGPHTYENYLRLANGTPYIIGFPGERYYEFDLSGQFSPKNTASWGVERNLEGQFIIFSSKPGETTIAVSDTEMAGVTKSVTMGSTSVDYTFKPSYLNDPELETGNYAFLLNADGNSYVEDKVNTQVAKTSAFRPYFTSTAVAPAPGGGARPVTRSIVFSNEDSQLKGVEEKGNPNDEDPGNLSIYAKKHKIIVESALTRDIDIRIVNTAGITVSTFTLEPGETVETRINNAGVYIVQSTDGRYIKKLAVR